MTGDDNSPVSAPKRKRTGVGKKAKKTRVEGKELEFEVEEEAENEKTVEEDEGEEEKKTDKNEEDIATFISTPEYVPTGSSNSSPDFSSPESPLDAPIQSHANVDLITFDSFTSANVAKLRQERDRLELAGLRKRRTLLRQLDRSTWPILFVTLQLRGLLASRCVFESQRRFRKLKLSLYTREEKEALRVLETQFPTQKSANVVDLCSKTAWRVDPRRPTYLSQRGKAETLTQRRQPTPEEEQRVIQNWKTSRDFKLNTLASLQSKPKQLTHIRERLILYALLLLPLRSSFL